MQYARLALLPILGASIACAATLTVAPHSRYPTPCSAMRAAHAGDTVLIDANRGVPYVEPPDPKHGGRSDCHITKSNLTIRGIHGRPVLDAKGEFIEMGIFVLYGHDIRIDNLEFRNAVTPHGKGEHGGDNGAGIKVEPGSNRHPDGGNITVVHCYIHDNQDGFISDNSAPGLAAWFSPHPFILLKYDDFARNGNVYGNAHNIYIGFDAYLRMKFTLEYSKSRDSYIGHLVKTRAPYNYILYNEIEDTVGASSYSLDFCLGGTTYVVGNFFYKTAMVNPNANNNLMIYRDIYDTDSIPPQALYSPPLQDLHFTNNVVIDNNVSPANAYVVLSCDKPSSDTCPRSADGSPLVTPAVIKGNLFTGPNAKATNQPAAIVKDNVLQALPLSWTNGNSPVHGVPLP